MGDALLQTEKVLLTPAGMGVADLEGVLAQVMKHAVDDADLYFQAAQSESWVLEDGVVKDASYHMSRGVGVRVISGEKVGLAYADDIHLEALKESAAAARGIAQQGQSGRVNAWSTPSFTPLYSSDNPLDVMCATDKIALLERVDRYARQKDPRVKQVIASLSGTYEHVLIAAIDGTLQGDIRPLIRFNVSVIAEQNGRREQGSTGGGGRYSYTALTEEMVLAFADEAVRQALVNLDAVDAPAGTMDVVLGPGWPGVLLHEAVGHGLEGDFNRKGSSAFSGRVGEKVASSLCTVIDEGCIADRRGSLTVDDEGVPTQQTVLIEDGILCGYMQDKLNARLMGVASTGNGRRESYAHLTLPRMTNTYMKAGEHAPDEIIAQVAHGIYAVNFNGGQVDITSGQFVFSASEAYLIEKGRVVCPVKGVTLIGHGPDVLTRVSMVGNDLALDSGIGVCGKDGQSVPVGVGQPTVLVNDLTVGGTAS